MGASASTSKVKVNTHRAPARHVESLIWHPFHCVAGQAPGGPKENVSRPDPRAGPRPDPESGSGMRIRYADPRRVWGCPRLIRPPTAAFAGRAIWKAVTLMAEVFLKREPARKAWWPADRAPARWARRR